MSRRTLFAASAALLISLGVVTGCTSVPSRTAPSGPVGGVSPTASAEATVAQGPEVTVTTDKGRIVIVLDTAKAPLTAANFVRLVRAGFYDGLRVHRVEADFVVQAGDPLTKGLSRQALLDVLARRKAGSPRADDPAVGTGGPGWSIPFEENDLLHDRGVIAMARSADPDSAGSQFYITLAPAHFLDGDYAVFGVVAQGMDVVDKLAVGDEIVSATVTKD